MSYYIFKATFLCGPSSAFNQCSELFAFQKFFTSHVMNESEKTTSICDGFIQNSIIRLQRRGCSHLCSANTNLIWTLLKSSTIK